MSKSFAQLFEESLKEIKTRPGSLIKGVVTSISNNMVVVDVGLKSESAISIKEFKIINGNLEVSVNDEVDVILEAVEDGLGCTRLSREKARRHESWLALAKAYENSTVITGLISGRVKGGFTVELDGIRAFLPGSLVEAKPVRDTSYLEGKELDFKVIKLDQKRNNIVVSRRAVLRTENDVEREQLLERLEEGLVVQGIVKNLTDYGAFIDLGGVDGLLHITDISWKRIEHPGDHPDIRIGKDITVKVLKFDRERTRVSLGLKQLTEDPWIAIAKRYPVGSKLFGSVTNLTDYGCFVEIEEGVEGLVHVSEMNWTNKNIHPSKVVNTGDKVEVMVLDIDEERRRISLGLKQCQYNPWQKFCDTYSKGDQLRGKIKSITDFGIFIGLDNGIDGLVHLSDISWDLQGEQTVSQFKKGDEIDAVLLQVDVERERISLGIKQLSDDPLNDYLSSHKRGDLLNGTVKSIDSKNIMISLGTGVLGRLSASETILSYGKDNDIVSFAINNNKDLYTPGSDIQVKYVTCDRKNRIIVVSTINVKDSAENKNQIDSKGRTEEQSSTDEKHKKHNAHFSNAMSEAFKAAKDK